MIGNSTGAVRKVELGRTAYYIRKAVQAGELVKLKNGLYIKPENLAVRIPDVEKIVPGGVLCLYSAWSYYNLTTQIPSATFIAIERSRKISLPDYPPISLCFWTQKYCTTGVSSIDVGGYEVKVFDLEKSVCDAVRFRTKIGMDVCSEVIKNYLRRNDKNIGKLMEYATILRVGKTLKTYLEIEL